MPKYNPQDGAESKTIDQNTELIGIANTMHQIKDDPAIPQKYCWCIDPGHGKLQRGKRSPKLEDGNQFLEYVFNRVITQSLIQVLDKLNIIYYNVVPEIVCGAMLEGRVYRANSFKSKLPKMFLSIHANAAPAPSNGWCDDSITGIETFCFRRNESKGHRGARIFQRHLIANTGAKDRGVKEANFFVLKKTAMPAILVELGFYNNRREVELLMNPEYQNKLVIALASAIQQIELHGL